MEGIKIAIHENSLRAVAEYLDKDLQNLITQIKFEIKDTKKGGIRFSFLEPTFTASQPIDKIKARFIEPNLILIQTSGFYGNLEQRIRAKKWGIRKTFRGVIKIKEGRLDCAIRLTGVKSSDGFYAPNAYYDHCNFYYDYNVNLKCFFLNWAVKIFQKKIFKRPFDSFFEVQKHILLRDAVELVPEIIPINELHLYADVSHIYPPRIEKGFLLLYLNGVFYNMKNPEEPNIKRRVVDEAPFYRMNGKDIQVYISEYSLKTFIKNIFINSPFTLNQKDLEKKFKIIDISLTHEYFRQRFKDFQSLVPREEEKEEDMELSIAFLKIPGIDIMQKILLIPTYVRLVAINRKTSKPREVLNFNTMVVLQVDFKIKEHRKIFLKLEDLRFEELNIIYSEIKTDYFHSDLRNIEKKIMKILNDNFFKAFNVEIPSIDRIPIFDVELQFFPHHIELHFNVAKPKTDGESSSNKEKATNDKSPGDKEKATNDKSSDNKEKATNDKSPGDKEKKADL